MLFSLPHTIPGHYRLGVSSFYFLQGIVFSSWASRIPDVKERLHLNEAELGSLLFAIPLGQLLALTVAGWMVARYGSRPMLLLASVFYPSALLLTGMAGQIWLLALALVLLGMGANLMNISVNTQACGVERIYGRTIMACFHGLWSLAGFVGGVLGMCMVMAGFSPLEHFFFVFALCMMILFGMKRSVLPRDVLPKPVLQEEDGKREKQVWVRPDRFIVLLGIIGFCGMFCEGTMYDWSGVYFADVVRPPENLVRLGYIACMCTMTCGRFMADRFVTRYGPVAVLCFCGILIAAGMLLAVCFPELIAATFGFLLVGFGISSIVPICYSLAGHSRRMQPGMALTAVSTISFFGFLLGPPLIGFIAQGLSLRGSLAFSAFIGLGITLLMPSLRRSFGRNQGMAD